MKIPTDLIPLTYDISKKVFQKELTLSEGTKLLVGSDQMNINSARDYIYNFRYLIQGKKVSRTLNADSMDYFFKNILKDYGISQLKISLSTLMQHIEYYEKLQKTTLFKMRAIHEKYLRETASPILISTFNHLIQNINTIESCLTEGNDDERLEASKLIKQGICFVAYKVGKEIRFAPSRFIGYHNNTIKEHLTIKKNGNETNKAISKILKSKPAAYITLEKKYIDYCSKLGSKPNVEGGAFSNTRQYWTIHLDHDFHDNVALTGEFPEGKIVERTHKARERNIRVIELAKHNFKIKHGRLFCQVCKFDFEAEYGRVGKNFIEGHHTIAVSDMPPDYKTKPEEIAMLCSNCHRMVHKRRPWLTMDNLSKILKK